MARGKSTVTVTAASLTVVVKIDLVFQSLAKAKDSPACIGAISLRPLIRAVINAWPIFAEAPGKKQRVDEEDPTFSRRTSSTNARRGLCTSSGPSMTVELSAFSARRRSSRGTSMSTRRRHCVEYASLLYACQPLIGDYS